MKKILYIMLSLAACCGLTACDDDAWGNGDTAMDHIYYVGFEDWGKNDNKVSFDAAHGATVDIPMQFWCEFVRPYDVVTYYWTVSDLTLGTDYRVVDANGAELQPAANGAYTLTWPQAKKGVQNVRIEALNGADGTVTVQTFDPASTVELSNQDIESTVQSRTDNYEVRIFTQNYKVSVNIK